MSQEKRTVAILQHHGDVGPGHFEDWLREHRIEYRLLRLDQASRRGRGRAVRRHLLPRRADERQRRAALDQR